MEWVVETVLPREVQKLTLAFEEKIIKYKPLSLQMKNINTKF